MVDVECKECPVRNFCVAYKELKLTEQVFYAECPLYRLITDDTVVKKEVE